MVYSPYSDMLEFNIVRSAVSPCVYFNSSFCVLHIMQSEQ